ncbi:P-loop containing nucleoside triphosphate hydrolase protein [Protomyces lactucae-debilis]|uniref:p-loop containing nucleoside triphosphate hydrolase protein n=1 Tax=Protomyces lactucae-debilis TaxID=2754530 RepID=A0A1Y2EQ11_PROLT|nr:P-loop containing nucleoside triphosphate hydrolase protein [Protomyces lactucae-debilis]ORY73680.1 P-loop containing nucleoside triphosphate hydrolase protein [Protomyces lactucae-debilis]
MREPLIALCGKPSSGKSTTLNSLTSEPVAKTGSFPFTTIKPNHGVGYLTVCCACSRYKRQSECMPLYGECKGGRRKIPVQLLDVAGLVPGASEGRGLGNQFLDDLRVAACLVHVVDASGTTDEQGKECRGYDPYRDVAWLQSEIVQWIYKNLEKKWASIIRRHVATKSTPIDTLAAQFSGYGGKPSAHLARVFQKLGHNAEEAKIERWSLEQVEHMVEFYVQIRFPTVLSLNKIDHADSAENIAKIAKHQDPESIVLTSAVAENLLRKLAKQRFIRYEEGTEFVDTKEDLGPDEADTLLEMDERTKQRVENLRDMVLYRYGSTGVSNILQKACAMLELTPVYLVKNAQFGHNDKQHGIFRDVALVKIGTRIGDIAANISKADLVYAETAGGVRVGADDLLQPGVNDILLFKFV